MITSAVRRSLEIMAEHGPLTPGWFADKFFPANHPGWTRCCKCGPHGSTRGSGLVMWAGGWLGKLRKMGLVDTVYEDGHVRKHTLTGKGWKLIQDKD